MVDAPIRTRSWLFTPATRPERFPRATEIGADVLIIDLEEAVASSDKAQARRHAVEWLAVRRPGGFPCALRINGLDTMSGLEDLTGLLHAGMPLDHLIIPKAESPDQIASLDRLLNSIGSRTRIVPLIESARGLAAVDRVALSAGRLSGMMFGAADMAADLGCAGRWDALLYARSKVVVASALAGVAAIDSPFFDVRDIEALAQEAGLARSLGFTGKAAIHPDQVHPINVAFVPDALEVERARKVLAQAHMGVSMLGGQMIDEAMARKARRVIAAAGESSQG